MLVFNLEFLLSYMKAALTELVLSFGTYKEKQARGGGTGFDEA